MRRWVLRGFILLGILVLLSEISYAEESLPSTKGMEVVGTQSIVDKSLFLDGNVTVENGGELIVENSILTFHSNQTYHPGVYVEKGGSLVMRNSTLEATNLSEGFSFLAEGRVDIRNCEIGGIFTTTVGLKWIGGFRIRGDNSLIRDTVFARARGYAVRCEGAKNFTFSNNLIYATATALLMNQSSGSIVGNWFFNNTDRQVVIQNSDGVRFENNIVNGTGMGGVIIVDSRNVESKGNQVEGPLYVVYIKRSQVTMEKDVLAGPQIQLDAENSSSVIAEDCAIDVGKAHTKGSSQILMKRTVRVRVLKNGNPVEGAIVSVKNVDGDSVAKGQTGKDGVAQFLLTEARVVDSGSKLFDPHTFKAVKGLRSFTGTANITSQSQVELNLRLPWGLISLVTIFLVLAAIVVLVPPKSRRLRKGRA